MIIVHEGIAAPLYEIGQTIYIKGDPEPREIDEIEYEIKVRPNRKNGHSGWLYYLTDRYGGTGPVSEWNLTTVKPPRKAPHPTLPERDRSGYVYVLKEVNGPHYKIGKTIVPETRLENFEVKLPYKIEYEMVIYTQNRDALEQELHDHFSDKRVSGEWFLLDGDDLAYIKSLEV